MWSTDLRHDWSPASEDAVGGGAREFKVITIESWSIRFPV